MAIFESLGRVTGSLDGYRSSIVLFVAGLRDFSLLQNVHSSYRIHPATYLQDTLYTLSGGRRPDLPLSTMLRMNGTLPPLLQISS
jgi:hypothetical protein